MGLVRWYRRLTLTRLHSLECMVWAMSAIVVTFMLLSLGKLHNQYEKKQSTTIKLHPDSRRVLSVQHISKDGAASKPKQQLLLKDPLFNALKLTDEDKMNRYGIKEDLPNNDHNIHSDTVSLDDHAKELYNFEELDGFNFVAHKEKQDADLRLSNNIKIQGNQLVVEEDKTIQHNGDMYPNEVLDPNNEENIPRNPLENPVDHYKNQWRSDILSNKRDLDDPEDMPWHEQQLFERNIAQHRPIKPNLPPEDEPYEGYLDNLQQNVQARQHFAPKDNELNARGTGGQSFQSAEVQKPETLFFKNEKYETDPTEGWQNVELNREGNNRGKDNYIIQEQNFKKNIKKESINAKHESEKLQQMNIDLARSERHMDSIYSVKTTVHGQNSLHVNTNDDDIQFAGALINKQTHSINGDSDQNPITKTRKKRKKKLSKRSVKGQNYTTDLELPEKTYLDDVNFQQSAFTDPPNSPVLSIYMKPNGRLGNQMFEIASLYGIAQRAGRKPLMSKYSDIYQIFTAANKTVAMSEANDDLGILFEEAPGSFNSALFSLPPIDLIICCYFQSWKYFEGFETDIRKMFQFRGKIRKLAKSIIHKAKYVYLTHLTDQTDEYENTHTLTYIGVHVRKGDMELEHHLRRGYRAAPLSYFHKAMDYYRKHYPNAIFLVTSDDMEWCKVKLGSSDVFFVEGQHEAVDLAVISMTNHTVISVGTFSWWAGWLAGGQVIYYKNWPVPKSEVAQQYNHKDYFPPKWKPVGD